MMSKGKTRQTSASSLSEYLGPGKEQVPSLVPTLRAALQLALHLQDVRERVDEVDKRNYPLSELMGDVLWQSWGSGRGQILTSSHPLSATPVQWRGD